MILKHFWAPKSAYLISQGPGPPNLNGFHQGGWTEFGLGWFGLDCASSVAKPGPVNAKLGWPSVGLASVWVWLGWVCFGLCWLGVGFVWVWVCLGLALG